MAVQFNLLPDVKLEFNRQQHIKRTVYTASFLAVAVAVALTVLAFFAVDVLQKKLLSDAQNDITKYSKNLQSIPNLDKVLTIQNQLTALPGLHQKKHVVSRLFDYLPSLTPTNVHIGKISLDTTANTLSVTGTADTVVLVNTFVDTLKFTNYNLNGVTDQKTCVQDNGKWNSASNTCTKPAFSNVILSKVDRDDKGATYTIDMSFDPALFDSTQTALHLVIPSETTTRSKLDAPNPSDLLFNGQGVKPATVQGSSNGQ